MYRVVFIDEDREAADAFKNYLDKLTIGGSLYVEVLLPQPSIEECLEMIYSKKPDAVVVDFQLNELKQQFDYVVPNGV